MNDQEIATQETVHLSGQDYAAHVQQNQDYYLKQFQRFSAGGFRPTWNWAAFLLPFAWPAYRRMYGWTIVPPLLFVILYWTSLVSEHEYPVAAILLCSLFLPGLLLGPLGNYLYFLKMRSAVRRNADIAAPASGPDTTMNGAAVALILCWGAALVSIGVSVPGYVSYRVRAYDAIAMTDLKKCGEGLAYFHGDRMQYPATLEEARCAHDPRVALSALELAKDRFAITASHAKGSKEFVLRSDGPGVFARSKDSGQDWVEQR